jgi:4-amino-4-deoxy-L-arabinose transferase-like glycosyltransferase
LRFPASCPECFTAWRAIVEKHAPLALALLTLTCLLPFCSEAFHIDDPLFIWAGRQILNHPFDPFGFKVLWFQTALPMTQVTNNPPLGCYYLAAAAGLFGFSEPALHLAFALPAIVVVLATYVLARSFTKQPLVAALAALFAPGFLVSGTSVMCDMPAAALWMLAILSWREGMTRDCHWRLALGGVLAALCALTKYFGLALIPLLGAYAMFYRRDKADRVLYLLIPVFAFGLYESWAQIAYGQGLLTHATGFAELAQPGISLERLLRLPVGLAFAGGCALPVVVCAPLLWPRARLLLLLLPAWVLAHLYVMGFFGLHLTGAQLWIEAQFALFIAGGLGLCLLAAEDWRRRRDADALLLLLWIGGTLVFTIFVNWAVNARSILPLLPAAGILLARNIDAAQQKPCRLFVALGLSALAALCVTWGDAKLADSARAAAQYFRSQNGAHPEKLGFIGRWGFQYYMQDYGFTPVDPADYKPRDSNLIVVAENNAHFSTSIRPDAVRNAAWHFETVPAWSTTLSMERGAGFYLAGGGWGPLPFAFGPAPREEYRVLTLKIRKGRSPDIFGKDAGYEHSKLP